MVHERKLWIRDDVIKWKHFPRYWSIVRGIHHPPVNYPHKGQWRGALMFSLFCGWTYDMPVIWAPPHSLWRHCSVCFLSRNLDIAQVFSPKCYMIYHAILNHNMFHLDVHYHTEKSCMPATRMSWNNNVFIDFPNAQNQNKSPETYVNRAAQVPGNTTG